VAVETGAAINDMLYIWRKWLLESADLPVVTHSTWQTMKQMIAEAVRICVGPDREAMQTAVDGVTALHEAYLARMDRAFYGHLRGWLPDLADRDDAGLPIFRPGPSPDAPSPLQYFHHPTWCTDGWQKVLAGFVKAFAATDPVELVFWNDPEQGMSVDGAYALIAACLATLGVDLNDCADIQLLTDPLDVPGLARLYASMHVIVPADDLRQLERGLLSGVAVMSQLETAAWRQMATRLLGRPLQPRHLASSGQAMSRPDMIGSGSGQAMPSTGSSQRNPDAASGT
jgi:hypothetical protein